MKNYDVGRMLRWYPEAWQERYGDEFQAFLEDRLDGSSPTLRFRTSIAIAGVRERCYGSGMVGARSSAATQRRTGSLIVLVAWSIMVVGGASLSKMAEHASSSLPSPSRAAATFAYNATVVAGIVGTTLVMAGASIAVSGFVRFLRARRWPEVRRSFVMPLAATVLLAVATIGLASWAHHLSDAQRNGADPMYSGVFVGFVLLVVVMIGLWTRTAIAVASRIDFTPRVLRWESYLALGVCVSSVVVVTSATTWWIEMGQHAPWFFSGAVAGTASSPWSANMEVTIFLMALATATALWGAARVALSYRSTLVRPS
jgi:hypothetical protein